MHKIFYFILSLTILTKGLNAQLTELEVKNKNEGVENVVNYAKFEIVGTSWLSFRDVEASVRKYAKGTKALDYGCGAGRSTRFLKSLGLNVTGMDISARFLTEASKIDQSIHYCKINSADIPVVDGSFDLVFSSHVLLDIPTKKEMVTVCQELHRVLKDDGLFISVTGSEEMHSPHRKWLSYETDFPENYDPKVGSIVRIGIKDVGAVFYDYHWTKDDYKEVIEESGFEVIEILSPLGKDDEGYAWASEKEHSPYLIYIAKKKAITK